MALRIEVTTAVSSTRRLFQFKVRPNGQALATESDTKPNFHRFFVSWDLADKLSRPILAAATSTPHSTSNGHPLSHDSREHQEIGEIPIE